MPFITPEIMRQRSMPFKFADGELFDKQRIDTNKDQFEENNVTDPNFFNPISTSPGEWTVSAAGVGRTTVDTNRFPGKRALKVVANPSEVKVVRNSGRVSVTGNDQLAVGAYAAESAETDNRIRVSFRGAANEEIVIIDSALTITDEGWYRAIVATPTNPEIVTASIEFVVYGNAAETITWFADPYIRKVNNVNTEKKWSSILETPDNYTVKGAFNPWWIPENYSELSETNQEMLEKFHTDTKTACAYAFRYKMLGNEDDAARAVQIISAYSTIKVFLTNGGSTLNWYNGWPLLIQAAMMVRESSYYTTLIDFEFKESLNIALATLEPVAYTRNNNWASWGLTMEMAAAAFFADRKRFDRAIYRWKALFNETVVSNFRVTNGGPAHNTFKNNVAQYEIYRMGGGSGNGAYGLLYSAFHLDALVIAAEWARLNGEWLFDHVSPDGSSLRGFWEEIAYLKRYGSPALSADYLNVQWFNTSNTEDPSHNYYYSGYYVNKVGASYYILQQLWPLETARQTMEGGFNTLAISPGAYPPIPEGRPSTYYTGVPILEDYHGMYGADIMYPGRPLYG